MKYVLRDQFIFKNPIHRIMHEKVNLNAHTLYGTVGRQSRNMTRI